MGEVSAYRGDLVEGHWADEGEAFAAVERRADRNAHGHIAQALRLKLLDDIATFISAIGGAGIMAGGALILGSENPLRGVEYGIAIVGAVITLVSMWQAIWQPGLRSREHKRWAAKFSALEDACRMAATKQVNSTPADLYRQYSSVCEEADLISEFFWRRSGRSADQA